MELLRPTYEGNREEIRYKLGIAQGLTSVGVDQFGGTLTLS